MSTFRATSGYLRVWPPEGTSGDTSGLTIGDARSDGLFRQSAFSPDPTGTGATPTATLDGDDVPTVNTVSVDATNTAAKPVFSLPQIITQLTTSWGQWGHQDTQLDWKQHDFLFATEYCANQ